MNTAQASVKKRTQENREIARMVAKQYPSELQWKIYLQVLRDLES